MTPAMSSALLELASLANRQTIRKGAGETANDSWMSTSWRRTSPAVLQRRSAGSAILRTYPRCAPYSRLRLPPTAIDLKHRGLHLLIRSDSRPQELYSTTYLIFRK